MLKVNVGVKFKIWTPQQLQIQKGEHRSLCNSFEWSSCLSATTFPLVSYTTSLSASAHGKQDSTNSIIDNTTLEIFIAVKIEKVLINRYGLKWLLTRCRKPIPRDLKLQNISCLHTINRTKRKVLVPATPLNECVNLCIMIVYGFYF